LIQDEKELIRNLSSSMDGPEVIMDAEEYLQPKSRCPLPSSSSTITAETPLPPPTPVKKYAAGGSSTGGGGSLANGSEHAGVYGAEGFSSAAGSQRTASPGMAAMGHHHHHHLAGLPAGHHPSAFHPSQHPQQLQPNSQRDSGGPSLRYCSDPLQLIGKGKFEFELI
jgi:L1 cell adhesion molecule